MTLTVERCRPEQAPLLTEIAHAAKRHWRYPERYMDAWRASLTVLPESIAAHEVWGAWREGVLEGFYMLIVFGRRAELEHMWVRPDSIGHGVGRRLLEHALELARAASIAAIDITSDPNAEGFYRHMGARRVGAVIAPVDGDARVLPRLVLEVRPSS